LYAAIFIAIKKGIPILTKRYRKNPVPGTGFFLSKKQDFSGLGGVGIWVIFGGGIKKAPRGTQGLRKFFGL
jgi:hypothetical protein